MKRIKSAPFLLISLITLVPLSSFFIYAGAPLSPPQDSVVHPDNNDGTSLAILCLYLKEKLEKSPIDIEQKTAFEQQLHNTKSLEEWSELNFVLSGYINQLNSDS